eukprot:239316_1
MNRINRGSSIHSNSESNNDDIGDAPFIHENIDNEEYVGDHIIEDVHYEHDNGDGPPTNPEENEENDNDGDAAGNSKEHTPKEADNDNDEEYPAHYRHPSLPANENPAEDDEDDMDRDHGRYLSTLIHEDVESESEMTPSADPARSDPNGVYQEPKNITRLNDYWCHCSKDIAIEDDTDAKLLNKKQTNNETNYKLRGSVVNKYTRPLISKISE